MSPELDTYLCTTYPEIFGDRYSDMKSTAMCWGFGCGDGWFNILNQACGLIQHHINWSRKNHKWDVEYNEAIAAGLAGDLTLLEERYGSFSDADERITEALAEGIKEPRPEIPQVVATQIKEKFGTLRFYYNGGDEFIHGIAQMAESMSGVTCEDCGKPGEASSGGWIKTLCKEHMAARGYSDDAEDEDNLLKQGYEA